MTRTIEALRWQVKPVAFREPLESWLRQQALAPCYLLAHAMDGVIWGWVKTHEIHTSHDVAPEISPPLRLETLQQLRLFNLDYEIRLWPGREGWEAVEVSDVLDPTATAITEAQLLSGTYAKQLEHGFIYLEDGAQGLRHIIPPVEGGESLNGQLGLFDDAQLRRASLRVRYYLTEDALGVNSIALSRLTGLGVDTYA